LAWSDAYRDRIGLAGHCAGPPGRESPRRVMTHPRHKRAKPSTSKTGLSPEVLEAIGKVLPGIIKAVAQLIEAISRLH
jgi:hypothetical protein